MKKVITYGTYDLLHYGHIRLLERAKNLGDYLIVGITTDDFDKKRGKINVQHSLMERIEAVKATGLADEIIVEEYEGQKIDDIKRYDVDIFTVGSDWEGKFDYLKEYCEVVYLDRTQGVSSTELRSKNRNIKLGLVGNNSIIEKLVNESKFVNGLEICSAYTTDSNLKNFCLEKNISVIDNYTEFLNSVDSIYIVPGNEKDYELMEEAIKNKKHVLCESPVALNKSQCSNLYNLASSNKVIFMDAIKTAYSTAFNRLLLLVKSGIIGDLIAIDSTCTSLKEFNESNMGNILTKKSSMYAWAPIALLPVFSLLGTNYTKKHFSSYYLDKELNFDLFTKIDFNYKNAVATVKIGKGVKSEGELIVSGTKGYIYVPAPWWKTDYFEVRFESPNDTKRYFYQLDGEGIRYELINFVKSVETGKTSSYVNQSVSEAISNILEEFNSKKDLDEILIGGEATK